MPKKKTAHGNFGFTIEFDLGSSQSGFSDALVRIRKPDGTTTDLDLSTSDDQVFSFVVPDGLLDQEGQYLLEPIVLFGSAELKPDKPARLEVTSSLWE